jgi:hypothetical protein
MMKNSSLDKARAGAGTGITPEPAQSPEKNPPDEQREKTAKDKSEKPAQNKPGNSSLNQFLRHIETPRESMPEREEYGKTIDESAKEPEPKADTESAPESSGESTRVLPQAAIEKGSEVLARTIDMVMDRIIAWAKREEPNGFVASPADLKNIRESLENYAYQHPELFQFAAGNELFITLGAIYGIPLGMALWYRFENPNPPEDKKELGTVPVHDPFKPVEFTPEQMEQMREHKRKKEAEKADQLKSEITKYENPEKSKKKGKRQFQDPNNYFPEKFKHLINPRPEPLPETSKCLYCDVKYATKDGYPQKSSSVKGFEKHFCSKEHYLRYRNENKLYPQHQKKDEKNKRRAIYRFNIKARMRQKHTIKKNR